MKSKGKINLIYIDMFYPYDYKGETFLATEIEFMNQMNIENVEKYIMPIWADCSKEKVVDLKNIIRIDGIGTYSKNKRVKWCLYSLLDKNFYLEIVYLFKSNRGSLKNIIKALAFIAQGNYWSFKLERYIKKHIEEGSKIILYSYWMHLQAYISIKVKNKLKKKYNIYTVSRCHRFDVYEYAADGYIPFRHLILNKIDKIYSISQDAIEYMKNNYKFNYNKISISRLGTIDKGIKISPKGDVLKIVSCSWMRKVKRNSMIFEAIKDLNFPVEWVHIGDGEEFNYIQEKIENLKNIKIKCKLLGRMNNEEVIEYYKTHDFNVFVNVSESEGVPVSIMEAMSFGKIIIATDVGGSKEVVFNEMNGYLLNVDFSVADLSNCFENIFRLSEENYIQMCRSSRVIWEKYYDAHKNYITFNNYLISN